MFYRNFSDTKNCIFNQRITFKPHPKNIQRFQAFWRCPRWYCHHPQNRQDHTTNKKQIGIYSMLWLSHTIDNTSTILYMLRTSPGRVPETPWAQGGPRNDTGDLWRYWWEGPSDPNVGKGPGIGIASHPWRLGGMRVRPLAMPVYGV